MYVMREIEGNLIVSGPLLDFGNSFEGSFDVEEVVLSAKRAQSSMHNRSCWRKAM